MGIKHLSYLDIPFEKRRESADAMRKKLQMVLSNPFLVAAQKADIYRQLDDVAKWEMGELTTTPIIAPPEVEEPPVEAPVAAPAVESPAATPEPTPATRESSHHSISVVDTIAIKES